MISQQSQIKILGIASLRRAMVDNLFYIRGKFPGIDTKKR